MRVPLYLFVALMALSRAALADAWVADERSVYMLNLDSSQVVIQVAQANTKRLAVDPRDHSAWVLSDRRLAKLTSSGLQAFDADLAAIGLKDADRIALDGRDGSIWIGAARTSRGTYAVAHLASDGALIGTVACPDDDFEMAVALDQSLWLLSSKRLLHYAQSGLLLANIDLRGTVGGDPRLIEVDPIGAWLWISGERRVTRIDSDSPTQPPLTVTLPRVPDFIATDPSRGRIWALGDGVLTEVDATSGTAGPSIDLHRLGIRSIKAFAFEASTRSLLLGHGGGLSRSSLDEGVVSFLPFSRGVDAIGVSPFVLYTDLEIVSPHPGRHFRSPAITLQLRATCSGLDCVLPEDFYDGYRLSVVLNGQQIGPGFTIDGATGEATFAAPLADADYVLVARATDPFGNVSNEVNVSFTIDIGPPFIFGVTPDALAGNAPYVTDQATVRVAGRVVGAASTRVSVGEVEVDLTQAPTGLFASFERDVPLAQGLNTIVIRATDGLNRTAAYTIFVRRVVP